MSPAHASMLEISLRQTAQLKTKTEIVRDTVHLHIEKVFLLDRRVKKNGLLASLNVYPMHLDDIVSEGTPQ